MSKDFLWVEKYRPKKVEEAILPEDFLNTFGNMVRSGEIQNMIFSGPAGLGKTTIAKALCNELNLDYILINGSEEGNIDTLRGKIKQFASTVSFSSGYKVVILDEADYLNPQSTQPALRGFIEQFSDNCRFILTCNFKNRIIEPIHSRCGSYEFGNFTKQEKAQLASKFFHRCSDILTAEGVEFTGKGLASIIMKYMPDWRRVINNLQKNSTSGKLDVGKSLVGDNTQFDELFEYLKEKDFKKMRQWVSNNMDLDTSVIIRGIYDRMYEKLSPKCIPQIVITLADYQYKAAFVSDHELNLVACMTEIMVQAEMK